MVSKQIFVRRMQYGTLRLTGVSKRETIFPILWATAKICSAVWWQNLNVKARKQTATSFTLHGVDMIPLAFIYLF